MTTIVPVGAEVNVRVSVLPFITYALGVCRNPFTSTIISPSLSPVILLVKLNTVVMPFPVKVCVSGIV